MKTTKRRVIKPTLETIRGWHLRYEEIDVQLHSMDRDADPMLVCELEIELIWLGERIAATEI
jgi:hypothetical protein